MAREAKYYKDIKAYMKEEGMETEDEIYSDDVKKAFESGRAVYLGSASNDSGDTAETVLCDMEIHYSTKELTVDKEAEY
jgi:hypothetical protein